MTLLPKKPVLFITAMLTAPLLLSACETSSYSNYTSSCPTPESIDEVLVRKYGHKDVLKYEKKATRLSSNDKLEEALSVINDGLALPDISDYGRFVLLRAQGHAYFNAKNDDEGITAFREALKLGATNDSEASFMAGMIKNIKNERENRGNFDAQPLIRIPPYFPPNVSESGHCYVKFDVSAKGSPENVQTTYCTNSLFKKPTIASVKLWKYVPKMVASKPVNRKDVRSRMTYILQDECGNIIPEPM